MRMTQIYIVRHAEAEGNLYRRIHGWYDSLITENGYRQIAALAQRFERIPVDAVYASDLFRTRTTAGAVYRQKGLPLRTHRGLREVGMGLWEDKPWGEVACTDGARLELFYASSGRWRVEGGESFTEVQRRMRETVLGIAAAHPGETVAIFSHGMAIRCFQGALRGMAPEEMSALGHCENTGVSCFRVEGEQVEVVFENDVSHIPEEISTLARQTWWKRRGQVDGNGELWFRSLDMDAESGIYYAARKDAWQDIHGSLRRFDGAGFLQDARRNWEEDPRALMLAMLGEEPAGLIQMDLSRHAEEGVGYIPFVYMTPQYRKQGLGVQLLGQAVSTFRPLGRTRLRLRCAPDNEVAQRFYHKYGFHKIGVAEGARVPLDLLEKYIGYGPEGQG